MKFALESKDGIERSFEIINFPEKDYNKIRQSIWAFTESLRLEERFGDMMFFETINKDMFGYKPISLKKDQYPLLVGIFKKFFLNK